MQQQQGQALDVVARRLIRASEEGLRHWMGVARLETDLLGALYLRVREVLDRDKWDEDMVEDITLTMFLTASAWQSCDEPSLDVLTTLHEAIGKTLSSDARRTQ